MQNYDTLLRDKEQEDSFDDRNMKSHWNALENSMNSSGKKSSGQNTKLIRILMAAAALSIIVLLLTFLLKQSKQPGAQKLADNIIGSAIQPLLSTTNVPYEMFTVNVSRGDTLFTGNGSVIIFPKHAVKNNRGEIVEGNIQVSVREFNDPFDYSIAGIPMNYDSAGIRYQFISSGMIDINARQNGEPLLVNTAAKPVIHLVSTNKEMQTNLYQLDTVSGKWLNKGKDIVNTLTAPPASVVVSKKENENSPVENSALLMPVPPVKASGNHPVINVSIDPASFKELRVYDGLKFEITDASTEKVAEDSKTEWDNITLSRGKGNGKYFVVFSSGSRKVVYTVKPVLEEKDFAAAEKIYLEKMKAYSRLQAERKSENEQTEKENQLIRKENDSIDNLNRLMVLRNKFVEAQNAKINTIITNQKRLDSIQNVRNQIQRASVQENNIIRSFELDGFGYWNCDQPSLPDAQQYVSTFRMNDKENIQHQYLCIVRSGVNRIQNYYSSTTIGLEPEGEYFGWCLTSENKLYYFTKDDFRKAIRSTGLYTISIPVQLYTGDMSDFGELKRKLYYVNDQKNYAKL